METIALRSNLLALMDGMSEAKLAQAANIPKATINRILSGRTPDPRAGTLLPIAQYFGVTLEQLLGIVPLPHALPISEVKTKEKTLEIPYINLQDIQNWFNNAYQVTEYHHAFEDTASRINTNCYATKVQSSSMKPKFYPGNVIIVNPSIKPKNEDYVIYFLHEANDVLFRQVLLEGVEMYLAPIDLKYGTPIKITNMDKCLGVVVKAETYLSNKDVPDDRNL